MKAKGPEEKDSLCISPGEWLNESEDASDREWREAALLALRVTGPSRTGGCKHTERNTNINILAVMLTAQCTAGLLLMLPAQSKRIESFTSTNNHHRQGVCFIKQHHQVTWICFFFFFYFSLGLTFEDVLYKRGSKIKRSTCTF